MSNNAQESGQSDEVFVLVEMYYPKDDRLEDLIDIAKASADMVKGQQGLIQTKVLRPKSAKGPVSNITVWNSQSEFQTFMKSDEVKALLKSETMNNVMEWSVDIQTLMFSQESGWAT